MITYKKLPVEQVKTVNESWETILIDWPQMYEIIDTKEISTTDVTTRENFVNLIDIEEAKKAECIARCDEEIAKYNAILTEIDKL